MIDQLKDLEQKIHYLEDVKNKLNHQLQSLNTALANYHKKITDAIQNRIAINDATQLNIQYEIMEYKYEKMIREIMIMISAIDKSIKQVKYLQQKVSLLDKE